MLGRYCNSTKSKYSIMVIMPVFQTGYESSILSTCSLCEVDWRWHPALSHKQFYEGSSPSLATNMEEKMKILYFDSTLTMQRVVNEKGIKKEQIVSILQLPVNQIALVYYE